MKVKLMMDVYNKCENCGRNRPLIKYELHDLRFNICEDCASAMSNMFYRTMENGRQQEYCESCERIITRE